MKKKPVLFVQTACCWLILILSLLVIFQTVALISQGKKNEQNRPGYISVPRIQEVSDASVRLAFVPGGVSLRKGETASMDLMLVPKRKLRLDGVRLVLSFNPEMVQLTQITTPKLFSSVSQNKEGEEKGKISLTFLEEKPEGLWLDKETKLVTLALKGIRVGESEIVVATEGEGPQTVITETGSSKKILFDYGNLKLVVY